MSGERAEADNIPSVRQLLVVAEERVESQDAEIDELRRVLLPIARLLHWCHDRADGSPVVLRTVNLAAWLSDTDDRRIRKLIPAEQCRKGVV